MEKIKKIFSPGHEKDDEVLYSDPNAGKASAGASHLPTATGAADHATEVKNAHPVGKENDLRRQALNTESTTTSRPAATGNLSSASGIADDASTASIRSGVVGGDSSPSSTIGSSGLASGQHTSLPDRTATDNQRSFPLSSDNTTSGTSRSHHGTEAALAGGAGAAGVGAYEANKHRNETIPEVVPAGSANERPLPFDPTHHEHKGRGHGFSGDPCPPGDEPQVYGVPHHVPGPHSTDMANRLDPHVPGEFPNDQGEDRHGSHHLGRDAALAGTAGAAGVGAYETHKHHDERSVPGESSNLVDRSAIVSPSTTDRSFPVGNSSAGTTSTQPSQEHHLGRDAAVAGGVGAAGLGAYEVGTHHHGDDQDPLSHAPGRFDDQRFDPSAPHADRPTHIPNLTYGSTTTHTGQQPEQQHHYGRDAAVAGGVGAAGAGAYQVGKHRAGATEEDPASYTTGPHKSNVLNVLDPRVQPEPEKMKTGETAGPHKSDALNRADPRVDSDLSKQNKDHHYGRDAAVAGGAGAVGYGAYEASKGHQDRPLETGNTTAAPYASTTSSTVEPGYGSTVRQDPQHHYGRDAAVAGGVGTAGVGAYEYEKHRKEPSAAYGSTSANTTEPGYGSAARQDPQHHYGRDAAVAGGVGAAGVGAYEYEKHRAEPTGTNTTSTTAGPHQSDTLNRADPRVDSDLSKQNKDHHYGRDAAVAGGAGVAGYGAYEAIDAKQQEKLEKERLKEAEKTQKHQQKELEKEQKNRQKAHDKEVEKEQKAAQKEHDHEQKKIAAAAAAAHEKEEKKHQKELEHEEKERQKAAEKAEKEREKEAEKGEKKHSILGFLHRDKNLTSEEKELQEGNNYREADLLAHERNQRELEQAAAAGTIGTAGAKFEPPLEEQRAHPNASAPQYISIDEKGHQHISTDQDGRHRLHKEPPASVKKSLEETRQ